MLAVYQLEREREKKECLHRVRIRDQFTRQPRRLGLSPQHANFMLTLLVITFAPLSQQHANFMLTLLVITFAPLSQQHANFMLTLLVIPFAPLSQQHVHFMLTLLVITFAPLSQQHVHFMLTLLVITFAPLNANHDWPTSLLSAFLITPGGITQVPVPGIAYR
jgi:hypothetical protein